MKKVKMSVMKDKSIWIVKEIMNSIYTIIDDVKASTILPIIRQKIELLSIVNTNKFKPYDGLVDLGYEKHYRVNHGKNEFAREKQHINGIESFLSYCKRRLVKFNGIKKKVCFTPKRMGITLIFKRNAPLRR